MAKMTLRQRLDSMRKHRRGGAVGRSMGGRAMAIGKGAVVGGAAQYAGEFAADKLDFVRNNWWGEGALLAGLAFLAQKQGMREYAFALAGAAGYSAAQRKKLDGGKSYQDVIAFAPTGTTAPAKAGSAQGIHDAGGVHFVGGT